MKLFDDFVFRSQSPVFNNGFGNCLKIEVDNFDDNDSMGADDLSNDVKPIKKKLLVGRPRQAKLITSQTRKKTVKVVHQCDQCDAKYTSIGEWTLVGILLLLVMNEFVSCPTHIYHCTHTYVIELFRDIQQFCNDRPELMLLTVSIRDYFIMKFAELDVKTIHRFSSLLQYNIN